ncbi:MAG: hypothetical protein Rubg2KO_18090 [Rubricoccaceae bacterium]
MASDSSSWRKTAQRLAPATHSPAEPGQYDLYPCFPVGSGKISLGTDALAEHVSRHREVVIDGYGGVFWEDLRRQLDGALNARGIQATWYDVSDCLRPSEEIEALCEPFLGDDDPIFGTRFTGQLADIFDARQLDALVPDPDADVSIVYGCGAALAGWDGLLVYLDVPKNEIQFRSRAGSITNLGVPEPDAPKRMYKRFYFVDWIALNQHKADLLPHIDVMVDAQRPDELAVMRGDDLRDALHAMSQSFFRVRPWFEPGTWGGQWIKEKIPQLAQDVPNYAWSFELIVPENGLAMESDGRLLEVSFDLLMIQEHEAVLGHAAERFGVEFPIRFDFLDTFDGGNLSLQCHPKPEYIRGHFGESFTQDETYYMLDCGPDARVYLGFQDDIDPEAFRADLERSQAESVPVDVDRHVSSRPARKHDLFLIPSGTVHCSGVDNMVLEISATPYIYTFKMYDWMRLDLDGKPRPINIERAFENLDFSRKGDRIEAELVSHPVTIDSGDDWKVVHLPTHPEHFYDVHRLEFATSIDVETHGSCQILSLVEGNSILLELADGTRQRFNTIETFVVPAASGQFRLINEGTEPVKVIQSFVKP